MKNAALQGRGYRLRPIADGELAKDVADMSLHGRLRYSQQVGDLLVALSAGYQLEHFKFAGRERRGKGPLSQPHRHLWWDPALARVYPLNRFDDLIAVHVLQQITLGS